MGFILKMHGSALKDEIAGMDIADDGRILPESVDNCNILLIFAYARVSIFICDILGFYVLFLFLQ